MPKLSSQKTLKQPLRCRGVGVHTGVEVEMVARPAPADSGIVFRRNDLPGSPTIAARYDHIGDIALCTTLANGSGPLVQTVEHLMAAFAGLEVDNAVVDLDGPEVPAMDGSAAPFVALIENAELIEQAAPRRYVEVLEPVFVSDGYRSASLLPADESSLALSVDYDNPLVGRQDFVYRASPDRFKAEIAPARTFGFVDDVNRMRAMGLAKGGSLDNAVVVGRDRILNTGGLRFANECVRHKVLDAIGDLYLAGGPILGEFHGVRSGHELYKKLLHALFANAEAWQYVTGRSPRRRVADGRRVRRASVVGA